MKTKSRSLVAFVLLSAASLTILFGSPTTQPSGNPQTEPGISMPGVVSSSSDSAGTRTRADSDLPSVRYGSHIDLNQPTATLEQLDPRPLRLEPNQIGVNRSVEASPNTRGQKFVNPDGSQIITLIIKSPRASGISVHFHDFELADDQEVYVYGAGADSIVFGPFTNKGPWGSGEFWSGTVDGDTVVIELYTRTDDNGHGFEIFEISHIVAELDWRWSSEPETVYFQYGRTTGYGSRTPNQTKIGNNYQNVSANISGLSAGTTYHFRIVGTNSAGTRYGTDRTFTTP